MRTHGTLTKWNDDRGFGFITPAQGSEEVFVHISAFPRNGGRPQINEVISFETETGPNGKPRAVRVMRPGQGSASRHSRTRQKPERSGGLFGTIFSYLAIAAIGAFAYEQFRQSLSSVTTTPEITATASSDSKFECDGRTMCSQMTSCEEAEYFLQHCPNTRMDGNNDGEPCEQQWCNY